MPWIFRRTDVEGNYKLISYCFVQGVIDGELIALVESGQLQTQRLTLI
jgi:hypothetical protein